MTRQTSPLPAFRALSETLPNLQAQSLPRQFSTTAPLTEVLSTFPKTNHPSTVSPHNPAPRPSHPLFQTKSKPNPQPNSQPPSHHPNLATRKVSAAGITLL